MTLDGDEGALARTLHGRVGRLRGWELDDDDPDVLVVRGRGRPAPPPSVTAAVHPSLAQHRAAALLERPPPGVTTVVAAGWFGGIGDLLLAAAAARAARGTVGHVAVALPDGAREIATPGVRGDVLDQLDTAALSRTDGRLAREPVAGGRRLAWFPAPVGPAHVVSVPGLEALTAPLHSPELADVHTSYVLSSTLAELVQPLANTSPDTVVGRAVRRLLRGRVGAAVRAPRPGRWAVVAEVRDEHDGGIVRAWANGTGVHEATAALVVACAARAVAAPPGVVGPGSLDVPGAILDDLADAELLRWSVARPEPARR